MVLQRHAFFVVKIFFKIYVAFFCVIKNIQLPKSKRQENPINEAGPVLMRPLMQACTRRAQLKKPKRGMSQETANEGFLFFAKKSEITLSVYARTTPREPICCRTT